MDIGRELILATDTANKEEDEEPVKDPYCYTTFINLSVIIERNWKIFSLVLPPKLTTNKKTLLKEFGKINNIRNRVMHPVKTRRSGRLSRRYYRCVSM